VLQALKRLLLRPLRPTHPPPRTYPEGYKPPDEGPSEYQTIPLSKIEDFGVHAKQVGAVVCC
jgi:hypothetical protein